MQKFILLDRDGVINARPGSGWITHWRKFHFLPRAIEALRNLNSYGYKSIVISNQSGVGRGLFSEEELKKITVNFQKEAASQDAKIEAVYYCTHAPEKNCECRKPRTGLLNKAQKEYSLDFSSTYFVGDTQVDLQAGTSVGCPVILISDAENRLHKASPLGPRVFVRDLYEAVQYILKHDILPPA